MNRRYFSPVGHAAVGAYLTISAVITMPGTMSLFKYMVVTKDGIYTNTHQVGILH